MKDFLELWRKTCGRRTKPRAKRQKNDGININPIPDHNTLPTKPPRSAPTVKEVNLVKKKDRLNELEKELTELREQSARQAELLKILASSLGDLTRSVAHLLPEK